MRLSITGQLLGHSLPLPKVLTLLASLDVHDLDVWPSNVRTGQPVDGQPYAKKEVAKARRTLDDAGMAAASLTAAPLGPALSSGVRCATDALKSAVDDAATLGTSFLNCYLDAIPVEVFAEAVRPAADHAGTVGVAILIENEAHDDSGTPDGIRCLIERVGSPNFGTTFDPCNFYQAGFEPYPAAYETLQDLIRYVHIKGGWFYDTAHRSSGHRGGTIRGRPDQYIGYGAARDAAFNIPAMLRRLARDGYDGCLMVEPHVPDPVAVDYYREDVRYLRSCLRQLVDDNPIDTANR